MERVQSGPEPGGGEEVEDPERLLETQELEAGPRGAWHSTKRAWNKARSPSSEDTSEL